MNVKFECLITKGKSVKTGKTYYKLTIVELGKDIFLSDTEAKLLNMLYPYTPTEQGTQE